MESILQTVSTVNDAVNGFVWGVPAMICIIGVGILLSVRTGFIQFSKFGYAIKSVLGKLFSKSDAGEGAVTPFQAVCTALAATVGTGNIAGVAGAIAIADPALYSGCGSLPCWECVPSSPKLPWLYISVREMLMATGLAAPCTT